MAPSSRRKLNSKQRGILYPTTRNVKVVANFIKNRSNDADDPMFIIFNIWNTPS
jgi:hypothetical protein